MYINDNKFGSFSIDPASIGDTSTHPHKIMLPYTGELPDSYEAAHLFMRVAPGDVRLTIVARQGRKETRYIIEATPEEITGILWPFFFKKTKQENSYATRFSNGLSNFWTGSYQRDFILWEQYTRQPLRIAEIVRQLTPEQRTELNRHLQRMEAESGEV